MGKYEEFVEEFQTLKIKNDSINDVMTMIVDADKNVTKEKIMKIQKGIEDIQTTDNEKQMIFKKFGEELTAFRSPADANRFLRNKFKRKLKLLENRTERSIDASFSDYIRRLRKDRKYTLKEVAKMAGMSFSYISRLEKGERKGPTFAIIEKLANVYNVPVETLLEVAGKEERKDAKLEELIYAYPVEIKGERLTPKQKDLMVELITAIHQSDWDENKHQDIASILNLIDDFKKTQQTTY